MGKLDGKVALITGAGSGIGQTTSLLFAKEGAKVAVVARTQVRGPETVRTIQAADGKAIFIEADVSKAADVERMVKTTIDTYGRIDILYNNAGTGGSAASTADTTEEDWDLVFNTNLKSVFLGSKYAIPVMIKQGGGVIINTASVSALGAFPRAAAYCTSKAGIIMLTKVMALEYGRHNIRVNCICPGTIRTPTTEGSLEGSILLDITPQAAPLRRVGQPEEIAQAALYLASDDSSYVTGVTLVADGGWTIGIPLPVPLDAIPIDG